MITRGNRIFVGAGLRTYIATTLSPALAQTIIHIKKSAPEILSDRNSLNAKNTVLYTRSATTNG